MQAGRLRYVPKTMIVIASVARQSTRSYDAISNRDGTDPQIPFHVC